MKQMLPGSSFIGNDFGAAPSPATSPVPTAGLAVERGAVGGLDSVFEELAFEGLDFGAGFTFPFKGLFKGLTSFAFVFAFGDMASGDPR